VITGTRYRARTESSRGAPTSSRDHRRTDAQVLCAMIVEDSMNMASLHDNSLPNRVENNLSRVVQIELLHQIGSVGLDR
jgi:hypothetical protein